MLIRKFIILLLITFTVHHSYGQGGVLSFSFDGIPVSSRSGLSKVEEVAYFGKFLDVLEEHKISSIGFALGSESEKYDIALLSKFVANGHRVGVQSHNKIDLNNSSAAAFIEDLELADSKLSRYLYKPKYYRFPELHYGNTLEKQDSVFKALEDLDFKLIPASCYFDVRPLTEVYLEYRNTSYAYLCDSIGMEFVNAAFAGCERAFKRAEEKYGREVRHILSLPYTPLTVDYLSVLIDKLIEAKWVFTSVDSAMVDPIYQVRYYSISQTRTTALDGYVHEEELVRPPVLIEDGEPLKRSEIINRRFYLQDFLSYYPELEDAVNEKFNSMTDEQRYGQLIVQALGEYGSSFNSIRSLVEEGKLGGVLLLKGHIEEFRREVVMLDQLNEKLGNLPLIYSADAEPSLINKKIKGSTPVPNTDKLKDAITCQLVANKISDDLNYLGVNQNYAPVCDVSNSNKAMYGNRSFSSDPEEVSDLSRIFIETSQRNNIIATAKHFPGHGKVIGDSHQKLVYINGDLEELDIYKPLIEAGVLSIMIGHIAIRNNDKYETNGYPASCSRKVISGLLKNELNYRGLIVSDAMNMGALRGIKNAPLEAVKAGCDMIIMPPDVRSLLKDIQELANEDEAFKKQVYTSVKKVIRMKYCLGLI